MKRYVFSSVLLCGTLLLGTAANANDCDAILKAYETMAGTPAYSQKITNKNAPQMESVAVGDVLYINPDGTWQKMQLQPGGRLGNPEILRSRFGKPQRL